MPVVPKHELPKSSTHSGDQEHAQTEAANAALLSRLSAETEPGLNCLGPDLHPIVKQYLCSLHQNPLSKVRAEGGERHFVLCGKLVREQHLADMLALAGRMLRIADQPEHQGTVHLLTAFVPIAIAARLCSVSTDSRSQTACTDGHLQNLGQAALLQLPCLHVACLYSAAASKDQII